MSDYAMQIMVSVFTVWEVSLVKAFAVFVLPYEFLMIYLNESFSLSWRSDLVTLVAEV